jgi:hypothetical protein
LISHPISTGRIRSSSEFRKKKLRNPQILHGRLRVAPAAATPISASCLAPPSPTRRRDPRRHNRGREVRSCIVIDSIGGSVHHHAAPTSFGGLPPPPLEEPCATTTASCRCPRPPASPSPTRPCRRSLPRLPIHGDLASGNLVSFPTMPFLFCYYFCLDELLSSEKPNTARLVVCSIRAPFVIYALFIITAISIFFFLSTYLVSNFLTLFLHPPLAFCSSM